jgi:hypothetical protein
MYLQTDPEIASTWSSYGYAENDPVAKVDPTGRIRDLSDVTATVDTWRIGDLDGGGCTNVLAESGGTSIAWGFCTNLSIGLDGGGLGGGGTTRDCIEALTPCGCSYGSCFKIFEEPQYAHCKDEFSSDQCITCLMEATFRCAQCAAAGGGFLPPLICAEKCTDERDLRPHLRFRRGGGKCRLLEGTDS